MKNSQGVVLDGTLYLGGGYTGNSKTDATVYTYDSRTWVSLSDCPFKWSALSVLNNELILVGGKEIGSSKSNSVYTNKIAVWSKKNKTWDFSLPLMIVPRMSPVVVSQGNYLIVAGGKKGSLDYRAEVLDSKSMQWFSSPALPLPCLSHTSVVVQGVWYLLDQQSGIIMYTKVSDYLNLACHQRKEEWKMPDSNHTSPPNPSITSSTLIWKKMATNPPEIPKKISSIHTHLCSISQGLANFNVYVHKENVWVLVEGRFPKNLVTGLWLMSDQDKNSFLVLGGETSQNNYSNESHKLTMMTKKELSVVKKSRHVKIWTD